MLGACLPPCVYEVVVLWELDNGGGVCRFPGYGMPTGGSSRWWCDLQRYLARNLQRYLA